MILNIQRLQFLVDNIPLLLKEINEKDFSEKPNPLKWSKKEILGHLIDSATNNHHRFVRTQFENIPVISYDQNKWNQYSYYQQINAIQLIHFWEIYNRQILELVKCIPSENLLLLCDTGDKTLHTLEYIFVDYVSHLEYHLHQIVQY